MKSKSQILLKLMNLLYNLSIIGNLHLIDGYKIL